MQSWGVTNGKSPLPFWEFYSPDKLAVLLLQNLSKLMNSLSGLVRYLAIMPTMQPLNREMSQCVKDVFWSVTTHGGKARTQMCIGNYYGNYLHISLSLSLGTWTCVWSREILYNEFINVTFVPLATLRWPAVIREREKILVESSSDWRTELWAPGYCEIHYFTIIKPIELTL